MYLGDDPYEKNVGGATVKVRDPWRVGILSSVTLGIYGIVWFYLINAELQRYAEARGIRRVGGNPILAVLGITLGAVLVIPFIATWIWTLLRIRRAQEAEDADARIKIGQTVLAGFVWLVPLAGNVVWHEQVQFHLNSIWGHRAGASAPESALEPAPAPA